eukprot:TRINITY_DN49343_c0_g1_i1.p1 TRINITY_DN49343_c0_g1~~TRINITY_DN49343_c0_g1_i1.p1  ORF type:complete len:181 (+),score=26.02 TRINITY_DN49343_c0_g1_i1:100-642(+)
MWRSSFVLCQNTPATPSENPFMTQRYRLLNYGPHCEPGAEPPPPQLDAARLMEGCTGKAALGAFGGGMMGLLMGGFFHTMQPMNVDTSLSSWDQIKQSYKGFGTACTRMSRNFAKVGCVYASVECFMERERAIRDVPNAVYAGCVTGAVLAFQAGPQAMAFGCGGFAAFSAVIETMMGTH